MRIVQLSNFGVFTVKRKTQMIGMGNSCREGSQSHKHFRYVAPSFKPSYVEGYFSDVCVEGGGVKLPTRCISASRLARNEIPKATPILFGSNFSTVLSVTLPD